MEKGHTSREFDRELRTLRDRLLAMGGRAEQQFSGAIEAVIDGRTSAIAVRKSAVVAGAKPTESERSKAACAALRAANSMSAGVNSRDSATIQPMSRPPCGTAAR